MWKRRLLALIVILLGAGVAYFVYATQVKNPDSRYAFKLGLDLSGGTQLIYRADVGELDKDEVKSAMNVLRDVVEKRVNAFGVAETNVQVQESNFANQGEERLIIDLPGITDLNEATKRIGQTPLLEFRVERPEGPEKEALLAAFILENENYDGVAPLSIAADKDPYFMESPLTGKYLKRANIDFGQGAQEGGVNTGAPVVTLEFNKEGAEIFEKITQENLGKLVAIYLDGVLKSAPVVQSVINNGEAVITGSFTPDEAKDLRDTLNYGALPLPIELVGTQSIGPSLGAEATQAGVFAGFIGFVTLSILLILWYRLPGVVAVVALMIYIAIMCTLIKIVPVTLTAAGIAGFIISLGLAVDGNILIAERLKEELRGGRTIADAIRTGFSRAWFSIRDSNSSSLITAAMLLWFGSSLIKGFALTLGLGALISMVSAVAVSRILLLAIHARDTKFMKFLFSSGFSK